MKRKRKKNRRGLILFTLIIITLITIINTSGQTENNSIAYKEIWVEPNDTLWTIAKSNSDDNTNIRKYIEQIKEFNGLSDGTLFAYSVIKVPEYR